MSPAFGHSERVTTSTLEQRSESAASARSRPSRIGRLVVIVALVGLLAVWWFAGGTFVGAPKGNIVGVAVEGGEDASFGFPLSADGGGAQLRSVSAQVMPEATVEWSAYQQETGAAGFGSWHGPLEPTWQVGAVDGTHVSQDAALPTWLIATVRSSTPGVFRVSNIAVAYQSGWRTRNEESAFVGCVLVAPAGRSTDDLRASNDPLWQEYEACWTGG